ncbi:Ger(x)C family spore germination protein [Paenibacillus sp. GCM10027627]|uniref:Ger(x)C family spore germination protein n=1 Tax=unclassified Paenibacillus TaxID=185978 RepID=UPI0036308E89
MTSTWPIRLLLAVCAVSMLLPLAGCWDIRYLDKLAVVLAIGVDDDPSGKYRYRLTVQIVLPQNATSTQKGREGSPVMTISDTGDTMFEAIRKMSSKTSRRLFFSHTQLLVISEKTAREGIYPLMDLIDRNADIRTDIAVMIARDMEAQELLEIRTQMESVPASQMKEMVSTNEVAQGQAYSVLVRDIARMADSGLKQVALPAVVAEGPIKAGNKNENVTNIKPEVIPEVRNMAVFKDGKLVHYLNARQSRGLAWLQEKLTSTVVKLGCPGSDGFLMAEVISSTTETKVKRSASDSETPVIESQIRIEAAIHEMTCDFKLNGESALHEIEKLLNKTVEDEMRSTVQILQKLKIDTVGWAEAVYRDQPGLWERISPRWSVMFPETEAKLECISHVQSTGTRSNSIVK